MTELVWLIGGKAGFGIREAGLAFAKVCSRAGHNVFGYVEYPSLIRGGHNTYQVRADSSAYCPSKEIDVLVALDKESIERHEIRQNGSVIYDSEIMNENQRTETEKAKNIRLYPVPLRKLAGEGSPEIIRNAVAVGASCAAIGLDFSLLEAVLKQGFRAKGDEIAIMNIRAAKAGYDYIRTNFQDGSMVKLKAKGPKTRKLVLTGNDAMGLGAIKAGCRFFAGYPMTPISPLIHFMAQQAGNFNIVFRNASDEIEAINMAIGASFAGARAMTATSGGGFSLMVEAFGMAGMTEIPVVIVEGTRTGPSTGLPTWTEQGDLRFVMHASQGEFPRIVAAPGDVEECYYKTVEVFELAEKYQVPAILLTDRFLAESHMSTEMLRTDSKIVKSFLEESHLENGNNYRRYKITESGVSPRSMPGQRNGLFIANSYEHDEYGFYCEEAGMVRKMKEKRMRKMEGLHKEAPDPVLYGEKEADITLVAWGSTKLPVMQAMEILSGKNVKVNFLHVIYMVPFKTEKIEKVLQAAKNILIVENNQTAQLAGLIREKTGINIENRLLKYDGRQFFAEEIADKVMELVEK